MEARDTVMSPELQEVYGCDKPQHLAGLEWQAEISFKAGTNTERNQWIKFGNELLKKYPTASNFWLSLVDWVIIGKPE